MNDKLITELKAFVENVDGTYDITELEEDYFILYGTDLYEFAKMALLLEDLCFKDKSPIVLIKNKKNFDDFAVLVIADREISRSLRDDFPFSDASIISKAKELFSKGIEDTDFDFDLAFFDHFKLCVWPLFVKCDYSVTFDEDVMIEASFDLPETATIPTSVPSQS